MRRFVWALLDYWQPVLVGLLMLIIVAGTLGYRLGSLTPGFSLNEVTYIHSAQSGKQIIANPVFAPHKVLTYGLIKLKLTKPIYFRSVSTLMGVIVVMSGFFIIKRWHSRKIALLGSVLLLSSSWLLQTVRLATPEACFLLVLPLLWLASWMYSTSNRRLALFLLFLSVSVAIYIPGFIWLILLLVMWQRKSIANELSQVSVWFGLLLGFMSLIVLSPLAWASWHDRQVLITILGLPQQLSILKDFPFNIVRLASALVWRSQSDAVSHLANLPLLDVFSVLLAALGTYAARFSWRLTRAKLMLSCFVILFLLASLGGSMSPVVLLPIIYLVMVAGLAFLLAQWFSVFPRNPLARFVGVALLAMIVAATSYYHISRYYVAWSQAPETRHSFNLHL